MEQPHHRIANGVFLRYYWIESLNPIQHEHLKYELVTLSQKKTRNWKILYAPISGVSVKFKVQNYQIKVDEKC